MSQNASSQVLFNGSLQFFADVRAALSRAASLLPPSGPARVVISHVNGAAFVRSEAAGNPATVLSTMPTLAQLELIARDLELSLVPPIALGVIDGGDEEAALEQFYLVALERG